MPLWGTILIAVLGSSGLSTIIVTVLQHHWQKKEKRDARIDALVEAQKVLMVDRVRHLGVSYIREGKITLAEKETVKGMYKAYKALGGNGHLGTLMEEVEHLPVVE